MGQVVSVVQNIKQTKRVPGDVCVMIPCTGLGAM